MENKDSRRYPRLKAEFTVQLDLGGASFRERAFSLGGGGLFITTIRQLPLQMGTEMAVRFRPAKHLPMIDAKAKVCYVVPGRGAALEFTAINDDDRRRLLGFIHNKVASRRKRPRAPLATQISCQESMSLAFSREISAGGMFIETKNPLPVGSRVTLRFNLSDAGEVTVLMGEVGYHAGNLGMGIRFVEPTPEDLQRIQDYVSSTSTERQPRSRNTKR